MEQFLDVFMQFRNKTVDLSFVKSSTLGSPTTVSANIVSGTFSKVKKIIATKKPLLVVGVAVLAIIGLLVFLRSTGKLFATNSSSTLTSSSTFATAELNKQLSIAIKDASGKATGNVININFGTAERTDKILINGKSASAKSGKDFLIINISIENSTKDRLNVRPIDFVRLVDDSGKSFAADVHNDVIKVEPLSSRKTRVGFVVDESKNNFKFLLGEVSANRQTVEIKF